MWFPVPVEELDVGEVRCVNCDAKLDEAVFLDDGYYCEACAAEEVAEIEAKAERFARENCKITGALEKFDAEREYRCTREEFECGARESHTANSVRCPQPPS